MEKSYIYVLTEDGSQLGNLLKEAATSFSGIHKDDAVVDITVRQSDPNKFEDVRQALEVRRIPALGISDKSYEGEGTLTRYVAMDRGVLDRFVIRDGTAINEKATEDSLYHLVADFHYVVRDEDLLHLKRNLTTQRVVTFLRATWEEVKDLVSISVTAR